MGACESRLELEVVHLTLMLLSNLEVVQSIAKRLKTQIIRDERKPVYIA